MQCSGLMLSQFVMVYLMNIAPQYIMTGRELEWKKHAVLEFGANVQCHKEHSNEMIPHTMGAICLAQLVTCKAVTGSCHCPLELGWHNIVGLYFPCHVKPSPGLLQSDNHKECWRRSLILIGTGMKTR